MDIEKIREQKIALEFEVLGAIEKFNLETGLKAKMVMANLVDDEDKDFYAIEIDLDI